MSLVPIWKFLLPSFKPDACQRALRAAASHRATRTAHRRKDVLFRERRGLLMTLPLAWRRCVLGTNHIAAHGVWRIGRRRAAPCFNRRGETRWHLCRRPAPSLSLSANPQQGARA